MLIWTGWGFLVIGITGLCVAISLFLTFMIATPLGWGNLNQILATGFGLGFMTASVAVWIWGNFMNNKLAKEYLDPQTNEMVRVTGPNHTLYFIKAQYWAIPIALLSIVSIFAFLNSKS